MRRLFPIALLFCMLCSVALANNWETIVSTDDPELLEELESLLIVVTPDDEEYEEPVEMMPIRQDDLSNLDEEIWVFYGCAAADYASPQISMAYYFQLLDEMNIYFREMQQEGNITRLTFKDYFDVIITGDPMERVEFHLSWQGKKLIVPILLEYTYGASLRGLFTMQELEEKIFLPQSSPKFSLDAIKNAFELSWGNDVSFDGEAADVGNALFFSALQATCIYPGMPLADYAEMAEYMSFPMKTIINDEEELWQETAHQWNGIYFWNSALSDVEGNVNHPMWYAIPPESSALFDLDATQGTWNFRSIIFHIDVQNTWLNQIMQTSDIE